MSRRTWAHADTLSDEHGSVTVAEDQTVTAVVVGPRQESSSMATAPSTPTSGRSTNLLREIPPPRLP